ncbi:hypothetical protein PP707_04545 [Acetobacter pasteurianus]|nr:hypothetical protein [Acetobacter pasteurianus]
MVSATLLDSDRNDNGLPATFRIVAIAEAVATDPSNCRVSSLCLSFALV